VSYSIAWVAAAVRWKLFFFREYLEVFETYIIVSVMKCSFSQVLNFKESKDNTVTRPY